MEQISALTIQKEILPFLNMAMYLNDYKFIYSLLIENESNESIDELEVKIQSDIPCIEPFSCSLSSIPSNTTLRIPLKQLKVNRNYLSNLSETEKAEISVQVTKGNETIASDCFDIQIQPIEYFGGFHVLPQLIASFVTPNHSYVYHLKRRAVELLESQGLKPAFDGYQSGDPERILQVMSALFTAIQSEQIIYSSLAPGYEDTGQRLRLLNTIQKEKFANCIDISLLFAACLEAADLHPIIIVVRGHVFVGCWLNDDKFHEVVNDDKTAITKRISRGIREIAVVEATTMCKGNDISFIKALQLGEAQLIEKEDFILSVDIKTARGASIRPFPLMNTDEVKLNIDEVDEVITGKIEDTFELGEVYADELLNKSGQPKTKQKIWERKLLDLSLRNNLINLRFSRNLLQLIDIDINILEDILWEGKSFSIQPHPNADYRAKYNLYFGPLHSSSPEYQHANSELKYSRLLTYYHQRDLDSMLTFMHKNAKQAIEENGSSTLFLGVGLLQWFDRKTPAISRLAPILLVPVEITRRSVTSKFTLKSREEETMINITLLEFLRQEYQMNLSGLEQLPQDEKGVDVAKVMGIFRRAIMQLPGWDVKEQLVLGNFSFSKLILWNDIVVHQDKLLESDMVRSLVQGKLAFQSNGHDVEDDFEAIESGRLTLPIPTDVSQMDAVLAAQKGQSFILHGPPGTGKSQTITNIIADALYSGKRVLFVAAKKAALDVVYKRLKQIGLEPFTLELHSNKSRKSDVLNQLAFSLDTLKHARIGNFQEESQRLDDARKVISEYVNLLHKKQPAGWSLYNNLTALENYVHRHFPKHFISESTLERLRPELWQQWQDWLPQFESIIQLIAHPSENPLALLNIRQYSISLADDMRTGIEELQKLLDILKNQTPELISKIYFPKDVSTRKQTHDFQSLVHSLQQLPNMPLELAIYLADSENLKVYEEWTQVFGDFQSSLKSILEHHNRSVLNVGFSELEAKWIEAKQSWFLPEWLKKKSIKKAINIHRSMPVSDDTEVADLFSLHHRMQEAGRLLKQSRFEGVTSALKNLYRDEETNLTELDIKVNVLRQVINRMSHWGYTAMAKWMTDLRSRGMIYTDEIKQDHLDFIGRFMETFERFTAKEKQFHEFSGYGFPGESQWLEQSAAQLQHIQTSLPNLRNWINYQQIVATGKEMELDWLIAAYEGKNFDVADASDYFHYTTHISIARRVIAQHESLSLFNTHLFESKIQQYKQIAEEYKALTIQEMRAKLASQLPDSSFDSIQSSEPGILQKAIRSKGRGLSIRKLFDQIPNLLPRLAPCMLMSPISVAQYFDVNTEHFDLLIFDEASQLPTCEAVSSLARAKQAIIVGDPKQMPPTSFFTTTKLDEENIEIEDLESILDDCLSLSMPSKYLLRHYRSRHESLIAFSNAHYYDNKLLTFPSADDLQRKVQYHHIPGVYDKGKTRTNEAEADAIVRYVESHFENEKHRRLSVGVVTFSQTQQTLIEEKLETLFGLKPEVEKLATEGEEPMFVKNLENVQGDERDIILFSIGYAPDENGKMSMNFGPLNRDGGWRRLNVAITRARHEMHVFATLRADQIDLSRTSAEGVAGLKAFLSFAESGKLTLNAQDVEGGLNKQQLSEFVSKRLIQKGLSVKSNVGASDFKVDVAVVHPDKEHRFILGIIIDGYHYYNAKTSNDREIVMPSVLKSLGWNIHRIWTMDWHENADAIIEDILERVTVLQEQSEEDEVLPEVRVKQSFEPARFMPETATVAPPATLQKPYHPAVLSVIAFADTEAIFDLRNRHTIKQQLRHVIEMEAPVSKSTLYRKVLQAWNIGRIGSRLDRHLTGIVAEMDVVEKQHHQPFYYAGLPVTHYRSNDVEKRKAEDIAPEEIAVALEEAVKNHFSIEEEELVKYLARVFDFARVGRQVEASIKYTIDMLEREGRVVREDGRVKVG